MGEVYKAIKARRVRIDIGVWHCSKCGEDWDMVPVEGDEYLCPKCDIPLSKEIQTLNVWALKCPECGEAVADFKGNWTGLKTVEGRKDVLCPKCRIHLNGLPLIHHGSASGVFVPMYFGTDYFAFTHEPCKKKKRSGFSIIYAVLIDNSGRVIFNLQCEDCGVVDALKTHTYFLAQGAPKRYRKYKGKPIHTIERIYLSPSLQKRVGRHDWDDL